MTSPCALVLVPNFIGGEWHVPAATQTLPVLNPSRGETIAQTPSCGAATVNDTVDAAAAAFPARADTPPTGKAAREFKTRVKAGRVGINIGVPVSMAWFPFNGWDDSFSATCTCRGARACNFSRS